MNFKEVTEMYGFQVKIFNIATETEREKLIEIEEPQLDREDFEDMGYTSVNHYMWSIAVSKALKMLDTDETLNGIELLYC